MEIGQGWASFLTYVSSWQQASDGLQSTEDERRGADPKLTPRVELSSDKPPRYQPEPKLTGRHASEKQMLVVVCLGLGCFVTQRPWSHSGLLHHLVEFIVGTLTEWVHSCIRFLLLL